MLAIDAIDVSIQASQILRRVSLAVAAREVVCLVGRNGAGKTTTLRTIMGYRRPAAGTITFRGEPIGGLPTHSIAARGIGLVHRALGRTDDAIDWLDARFPDSASRGRRIYASRADAPVRYVSNEAEIRKMLEEEHGFETLAMSTLPLEDQIRAFREASIIVGAHGAAFAHLGECADRLPEDETFSESTDHSAVLRLRIIYRVRGN